jgi:hypothetical protein
MMPTPKRIEEITVEDLTLHRWCYFHDDDGGVDSFEWVIPDTHPKFSEDIIEMELATFRFQGGEEFAGMFDGSESFSVYLAGRWYTLWYGVRAPSEHEKANFKAALRELGLNLPVNAKARWSGKSVSYSGLRYLDEAGIEIET